MVHDQTAALAGVHLHIDPYERVALVGASGAGKTTLLDVLSGRVSATSGSVDVLAHDIERLRGRGLRRHRSRIGLVTQDLDVPLALRVVHNVNAGRLGTWSTAGALLSLVRPSGRSEAVDVLEQVGLGSRLLSRTAELSGGERQRVAVARVLRQQPDLVLADEPTSSVDPRLADDVMGLLCGPPDTAPWTTVVSVHDPALARRHATRLVGLERGLVVFDRPADQVSDEELSRLYESGP